MEQMDFEQAWKFLEEKGLSIGERMNVRNAFYQAASQRSNVIKTENYFQNIKVPNYGFTTEEEADIEYINSCKNPKLVLKNILDKLILDMS